MEKWGVKRSFLCYTVNESLAAILGEIYGRTFQVIRNVPVLQNDFVQTNGKEYIIYQGALNKGRGLAELIQAMQDVESHLLIAGKGDIEGELKDLVRSLNVESKVTFTGELLPKDLRKIGEKAVIGVNLLEDSSLNYFHSLANKFFDYMHLEIPSVSMNFPEYTQVNDHCEVSILIPDLNPNKIASAINQLLLDAKVYNRLVENCKLGKQKFNWQNESKKLGILYQL